MVLRISSLKKPSNLELIQIHGTSDSGRWVTVKTGTYCPDIALTLGLGWWRFEVEFESSFPSPGLRMTGALLFCFPFFLSFSIIAFNC